MASDVSERVAASILEDRDQEGYYRDAERLTFYLLGSYAPGTGLITEARAVADGLLEKLTEPDAPDVSGLASLLDEWTETIRAKAARAP